MPFEFRVAGTGFDRRYTAIRRHCAKRSEVRLLPEHDNPHDANAISVYLGHTTAAGREDWDHIGYVPAELSPVVGELISSGEWAIEQAFVRKFDASPDLDAPRVTVRLEGKDLRAPLG